MENRDVEILFRDARFQARIRSLCRKYWKDDKRDNAGFWNVGSTKGPAYSAEDLEGIAWDKIMSIPPEKVARDSEGAPMQNYLITAVQNDFKDQLRVASARWKKHAVDYLIDDQTPAFPRSMPAKATSRPNYEDDSEGETRLMREFKATYESCFDNDSSPRNNGEKGKEPR